MSEKLAKAAENLANDKTIMNSYNSFYNGSGFYLTKNSSISGATGKPQTFPSTGKDLIASWKNFGMTQRKYLLILADLKDNQVIMANYQKIKNAYNNWDKNYYVVFLGTDARWSCNLFVGEALYMAGKKCLNGDKKYYSAEEIWRNNPNFTQITKSENVERGNIVAFHGSHVEIVTKVNRGRRFLFFSLADEFCSIGAGRGSSGNGDVRCGGFDRELKNSNNKFYKV